MRTFIAISLPQTIQEKLSSLQRELKATEADVKWVPPGNMHLTLKFLGETEDKLLPEITDLLREISRTNKSFLLRLSHLGAYPKISAARIIWMGIEEGKNESRNIAQALGQHLLALGFPQEERDFSAHITLGRVKSGFNRDKLTKQLTAMQTTPGNSSLEFLATTLTLYKSTLTPKGPTYETLIEEHLSTI
jgi:2'-5' RNA ligase